MNPTVINQIKSNVDSIKGMELWTDTETNQIKMILDSAVFLANAIESDLKDSGHVSDKTRGFVSCLAAQCVLFLGA